MFRKFEKIIIQWIALFNFRTTYSIPAGLVLLNYISLYFLSKLNGATQFFYNSILLQYIKAMAILKDIPLQVFKFKTFLNNYIDMK